MAEMNECTWQPYRTNTYMDGLVGAVGEVLYQSLVTNVKIIFIFAEENVVVIGTSERHVLKVVFSNLKMISDHDLLHHF
jgi:hypothetical protein